MVLQDDFVTIGSRHVADILRDAHAEVTDVVREAYKAHAQKLTILPRSVFLRLDSPGSARGIALPAFIGGPEPVWGMKWVTSFPTNHAKGHPRASAVVVLNCAETGRTRAVLDATEISATRTGAAAAMASRLIRGNRVTRLVGVVGCGPINEVTLEYLHHNFPELNRVIAYDLHVARAHHFAATSRSIPVEVASSLGQVLEAADIVSFATTAVTPHVLDLRGLAQGATVLNISLRDLTADVIRDAQNVVDDVDHVCRENTSVHLAEQAAGHRDFIHATVGELLLAEKPVLDPDKVTILSPFGLGILDIAVAEFVRRRFCAEPWSLPSRLPCDERVEELRS